MRCIIFKDTNSLHNLNMINNSIRGNPNLLERIRHVKKVYKKFYYK